MMYDARQIMRAMLLGLAPPEHRKLSLEDLRKIGYTDNAARTIYEAGKAQGRDA
jgi:hypothetical protein